MSKKKSSLQEDLETQDLMNTVLNANAPAAEAAPTTEKPAPAPTKKEVIKLHKAYNVFYSSKEKKFMLVTIEYNPKNLDYSRVVSVESVSDNGMVANKKLMDIVSLKLVRGEENVND